MKYHEKLMYKRLLSGFLAVVLVMGSVISPLNTQTTYATNRAVRLNYENHSKKDVEIYVQSEIANYNPGDDVSLDLYVQNNSEELLNGIGLSWGGDESAFEEAYFILPEDCDDATVNENGNVINLNLEPGEIREVTFEGTLSDELEPLDRKELTFFYGSKNESGIEVTDKASYEFTIGLFGGLEMEFANDSELIPGEKEVIDIRLNLEDIGYYYAVEDVAEYDTASDSNVTTASDSNTEVVTDSNSDEDEDYVFEITGVTLNLDTYGIKLENVALANTEVDDETAAITATVQYEVAKDAEPGTYFGTLQAVVSSGKKKYKAEIGVQFEVVEAEAAEEGHILECKEECSGEDCECECHATQKSLIEQVAALLAEVQTYDEETDWEIMYDAYDALYGTIPDAIEAAYDDGKLTDAEFGYLDEMFAFYGEQILGTLAELGFDPYDASTLDLKTYYDDEMNDKFYWRLDAGYIDKDTGNIVIKHDEEACNAFAEKNESINSLADMVTVTYGPAEFTDNTFTQLKLNKDGEPCANLSLLPYGGYIINSDYMTSIWDNIGSTAAQKEIQESIANSYWGISEVVSVLTTEDEARGLEEKNSVLHITTKPGYIVSSYRICCEYARGNWNDTSEYHVYAEKCKTVNINSTMLVKTENGNIRSDFYILPTEYEAKSSGFYDTDGFFEHKSETYQGNPQANAIGHHYALLLTVEKVDIPKPETGDLTISKEVTGIKDVDMENYAVDITVEKDGNTYHSETLNITENNGKYFASTTLKDIPVGKYTVTETVNSVIATKLAETYSGPTSSIKVNGSKSEDGEVTVTKDGEATVAFTNAYKLLPGNLTVTKTVEGVKPDTNKSFSFKCELSDKTINMTYGGMTFINGVATFTLKHGESKTATGLPADLTYTVTETEETGYKHPTIKTNGNITSTNKWTVSGTIPANQAVIELFVNEVKNYKLEVTKHVSGSTGEYEKENSNKTYSFRIRKKTGPESYEEIKGVDYKIDGKPNETLKTNSSTGIFTLKDGETAVFEHMIDNTKINGATQYYEYFVEELIPTSESDWYTVQCSATLKTPETINGNKCYKTADLTATSDQSVTFTNTPKLGSLKITKAVEGIKSEDMNGYSVDVTVTRDVDGKEYDVALTASNNYTVTLSGLLIGDYEVVEETVGRTVAAKLAVEYDGPTSTVNGEIGTSTTATVMNNSTVTVNFVNTYVLRSLNISKNLTEGTAGSDMQYAYVAEKDLPVGTKFIFDLEATALGSKDSKTFRYMINAVDTTVDAEAVAKAVKVNGVSPVQVSGLPTGYMVYEASLDSNNKATIELIKVDGQNTLAEVKLIKIPSGRTYKVTERDTTDVNALLGTYTSKLASVTQTGGSTSGLTNGATFTWTATGNQEHAVIFFNEFTRNAEVIVIKEVKGTNVPEREFLIQIKRKGTEGTHVDTTAILVDSKPNQETRDNENMSGIIRIDKPTTLVVTETSLKDFNLESVTYVRKAIDGTVIDSGTLTEGSAELTVYPGNKVEIIVTNQYNPSPYFHDDFGKMNDFGKNNVPQNPTTKTTAMAIETRFLGGSRKEEDLMQSDETLLA